MAAPAVVRIPPPAPVAVPAVASLAVRTLIAGKPRRLHVLGTSSHAVWLGGRHDVLVISTRDATRLPNCVELPLDAAELPLSMLRPGETVMAGGGSIVDGSLSVRVVRWWDPRPVLPSLTAERLEPRLRGLPEEVTGIDSAGLARAIRTLQPAAVLEAASRLLGLGGGLTPEADDVLAGTLAATRCLGAALRMRNAVASLDAAAPALAATAWARTTTFSAALIRHALHGEVAAPAAAFLNALGGRGDVAATHTELTNVGHSSGGALAAGIVLAGRALIEAA